MSKIEREVRSAEKLKVKSIIIPLMNFNKQIFHTVLMNCKETLECLEIKNELNGKYYTTKFLHNGLKHLKALKELKVHDMKKVIVIVG